MDIHQRGEFLKGTTWQLVNQQKPADNQHRINIYIYIGVSSKHEDVGLTWNVGKGCGSCRLCDTVCFLRNHFVVFFFVCVIVVVIMFVLVTFIGLNIYTFICTCRIMPHNGTTLSTWSWYTMLNEHLRLSGRRQRSSDDDIFTEWLSIRIENSSFMGVAHPTHKFCGDKGPVWWSGWVRFSRFGPLTTSLLRGFGPV